MKPGSTPRAGDIYIWNGIACVCTKVVDGWVTDFACLSTDGGFGHVETTMKYDYPCREEITINDLMKLRLNNKVTARFVKLALSIRGDDQKHITVEQS